MSNTVSATDLEIDIESHHFNSLPSLFQELDIGIIKYGKNKQLEPYTYKTNDLDIPSAKKFDLPIPAVEGSIIKFHFSTTNGDIIFSIIFNSNNKHESVIEPSRVPSDTEPITGAFKAPKNGVFVLTFDNTFSWFNPKMLSYKIELFQPPQSTEKQRCITSHHLLRNASIVSRDLRSRLEGVRREGQGLAHSLPNLQSQMNDALALYLRLQAEAGAAREALQRAESEEGGLLVQLSSSLEKERGLFIRCLSKPLLRLVFSFLSPLSAASSVSLYWWTVFREQHPLPLPPI